MEAEAGKMGLDLVELGGGEAAQGVLYVQDGLMQGPSGEQYVTIIQDGQTYAIPASDYAAMMAQQGLEVVEANGEARVETQEAAAPAASTTSSTAPAPPPPARAPAPPPLAMAPPPPPLATVAAPAHVPTLTPCAPPHQAVKAEGPGAGPTPETKPKLGGPSMRWMAPGPQSQARKPHAFPTMQQVVAGRREEAPRKNYQPIRVDNWGIFLLSRLQNYFTKKELCDLTLRFPAQNAQIKVHRLILSACTEYFSRLEQEGGEGEEPGATLDMPGDFTPEALAPIIRFMYTGRLDLKEGTFDKMYQTARTLQMSVLTKLMDAQVNGVSVGTTEGRKPVKRSNGAFDDDPVEQIRKIRKIERRVAQEERRRQVTARARQEEAARLPGKKLPIWKKRPVAEGPGPGGPPAAQEQGPSVSQEPAAAPGPAAYRIPKVAEGPRRTVGALLTEHLEQGREDGQLIPTPVVSTTYRKRSPGEKPKIPRRLQEIQQHLMFEKILKTGTRNPLVTKKTEAGPEAAKKSSDLSLEEVKALVEEQKQRMAATTQDDEEDDYYEDPGDIGDNYIDTGVDSPAPAPEPAEEALVGVAEPEAQKKSVRFSLRPNPRPSLATVAETQPKPEPVEPLPPAAPVPEPDTDINVPAESGGAEEREKQQISLSLPEPRAEGGMQSELDEALEEFSRVAEEEEAEERGREGAGEGPRPGPLQADHTRPRRGRPPRWLKEQTLQMGDVARRRDDPPPGPAADQAQVINEVMKKYPNLFKDNKQVKIKVVTKDPAGRSVTKLITLKSHPSPGAVRPPDPPPDAPVPAGLASLKPVTKVMYTGKRGRPKKVKPGMHDPHQAERRQIEERLMRDYPTIANQMTGEDEEGEEEEEEGAEEAGEEEDFEGEFKYKMEEQPAGGSSHQPMDPSSEAEAMSHVASGIAASLGLVEHHYPGQVVVQDGQLVLAPGQEYLHVLGQQPLQYSLKDPHRLHPLGPDLSLPPGLIPVSSGMFASPPTLVPVTSDHLLHELGHHPGPGLMPLVVPAAQHPMMLQAVSSPGIMVMAPHVMASMASMTSMAPAPFPLASTVGPLASTSGTLASTSGPLASNVGPLASNVGPLSSNAGPMVVGPGTQAASGRASPGALRTVTKIASDWDSDDDQ